VTEIVLVYGGKWPTVLGVYQSGSELIPNPNLVLVLNISKTILLPFCVLPLVSYGEIFTFTYVWLFVRELMFYVLEHNNTTNKSEIVGIFKESVLLPTQQCV
jgi:hypothetical protein